MTKFPLMRNNILREDLDNVIEYLKQDDPILTNGSKVREFEEKWSEWLGVKYSVFVNSGSSANLLSLMLLKEKFPNGGEVIVPPLTWISDIASVIFAGFKPIFCDIDIKTLGLNNVKVLLSIFGLSSFCLLLGLFINTQFKFLSFPIFLLFIFLYIWFRSFSKYSKYNS